MVDCLDAESQSIKGKIAEVGLTRDEEQYNTFNITLSMVLKSKSLTYDEGEQLMREFRKELLGKDVEIAAIVFPCPVCGKGFNTEQGMKQHVRMVHEKKRRKKEKTKETKQAKTTRKGATMKGSSKGARSKK
jgi:uncharacterized C2H2 Zn-finger protein